MTQSEERVTLEQTRESGDEITFTVSVDGVAAGEVRFLRYYEPRIQPAGEYAALWAGPTFCVVDVDRRTVHCRERDDETHRVHLCGEMWCVEGELSLELFHPATGPASSYAHNEVIMDSWLQDGLICIRDFEDRTLCFDPNDNLRRVEGKP